MARSFSSAEAAQISESCKKLISELKYRVITFDNEKNRICEDAKELQAEESQTILRGIPVEEINRGKNGFRVKLLRENGYNTIADIVAVSGYKLSYIYGISSESAYAIKEVANEIADNASQGIKVKLSTDHKTPCATNLVLAISKYRHLVPQIKRCQDILDRYESKIQSAIKELRPGTTGIRWLFAGAEKKQKAGQAYLYLTGLKTNTTLFDVSNDAINAIDTLRKATTIDCWYEFEQDPVGFINVLENIYPDILGTNDTVYGLPENLAKEIQEQPIFPDGLLCTLRRYQEWGVKYILHQERVLLGDEMGLGKTVQAIAAMVSLCNTGARHFVVVCPASVLTNWCREISQKSKLLVTKVHGARGRTALKSWLRTGGVAVTTYETTKYFDLDDFRFALLVVDEAHYIKNPEANRSINVRELCEHANRLLFMTGTALENRVDEMISLIYVLQPKVARSIQGMEALSAAPRFRQLVAPVYYRRKRDDVLTELPELIETEEWCTLSREEEQVYENAVLSKNYSEARRVSWNIDDLRHSSKANRLRELVEDAKSEGRKVIVFSFFLDTIGRVKQLFGSWCMSPITGAVSPQRRQEIIDDFDKAPAGTVLVAQIQSGGTGLNIQSASVVVICEPQFKPSIENQAISRAYRMGQTRNVLVFRLLCEDTVEEKINSILASKQAIFDAFADKSEAAKNSQELDDRTFGNLIQEEIDRINAKYGNICSTGNTIAYSQQPI